MLSLRSRLTSNLVANAYSQVAGIIAQLVLVPSFLYFWTKVQYGEWILLATIPSYLSLADSGFSTMSSNDVAIHKSRGDNASSLKALHTAWVFLLVAAAACAIISVFISLFVPWTKWLKLTTTDLSHARIAVIALILYTTLGVVAGIFESLYRAAYAYPRITIIHTTARLVEIAMTLCTAWLTHSFATLAFAMLGLRIIECLVLYIDSNFLRNELTLGVSHFSWTELKRIMLPSLMFLAFSLGGAFYFQGLNLVVGTLLGTSALVLFITTRVLTRAIVQSVNMIKSSIAPEFSYLYGRGEHLKLRRLNALAFELAFVFTFILAIGIFILGPWFIGLWTHHQVVPDKTLLCLFLTSAGLNGLWGVLSGLLMGTNTHEGLGISFVIATFLSLVVGYVLVANVGIYGPALAMIGCELYLLPYAIKRTCRLIEESPITLILETLKLTQLRIAIKEGHGLSLKNLHLTKSS